MGGNNNVIKHKAGSADNNRVDVDYSYDNDPYNTYYGYISVAFRVLSFVFLAAFLLYIIITAFNNAADFSYDNFEYIMRNFALTLEENKDDSVYAIEYNPDANRSYSLFDKGLAVCGNSGISIYSATGRLTCSESFLYKDPKMTASDKFALVYDHSDEDYSVYNSFSRVYSDQIDGVIRGAAMADNGFYALIVSSDEYNTAVELYNGSFSLINRFNKLGYVVDIDINDNYLMIASVSVAESNSFITELQVFDYNEQAEVFSITAEDNFPLKCKIGLTGFTFVGSKYTAFYGEDGRIISSYDHNGMVPCDFSVNYKGTVLLFKDNGFELKYTAVVLDENGSVRYTRSLSSTVFDVDVYNGRLYYLTDGKLICTDGENDYAFAAPDIQRGSKLLSFNDISVYVCTDTSAPLFIVP